MPDVIGQTQDQATAALKNAGLTAAPATTSDCNSTSNGNVVTQNPAGGASVGKGSSVTITVCAAATPVTVPNVIGQTQDQATATLSNAGLTAGPTTTSDCNSTSNGNVVTQNPAAGASVSKGSSVTIGVCSAVSVPNVIRQTQDQATTTLSNAGLTADPATTGDCRTTQDGLVVTQDPAGGTSVGKGSSVAIGVCSPTPVG